MTNRDITRPFAWGDLPAAVGLLTRLPVRLDPERAGTRGAAAAWAYPLAGLLVGGIAATVGWIAIELHLPVAACALLILSAQIILTGAMHEDGLADTADGFWGGWTTENRLHIMKDSSIGSYGVLALCMVIGLRWAALTALLNVGAFVGVVICVAMLSRATMTSMMHVMPHARSTGLSRSVGRPVRATATFAVAIGLIGAVVAVGPLAIPLILMTIVAAASCGLVARSKIGGQTGDVLGATQQVTETAVLLTAAALLAG